MTRGNHLRPPSGNEQTESRDATLFRRIVSIVVLLLARAWLLYRAKKRDLVNPRG
jgi:hypothetical protein